MDKNELKRLERADAKIKKKGNIQPLYDWAAQFEQQLEEKLNRIYEEKYHKDLADSIDCWIIAIMYTLHFSEKTKFGSKRLNEVMEDLQAVISMFETGEYTVEDYKKELEKDKIYFKVKR